MKKIRVMILLIAILPFLIPDASAQETEENVRMEYLICTLNEGFTFEDVIKDAKEVKGRIKIDY